MALRSMTGFGRGEASAGGVKVEVELSSVNRKQFDVRVGLPRGLVVLESRVNEVIHAAVSRGSVSGAVSVTVSGRARGRDVVVDADAAAASLKKLRVLARALRLKDDLTAQSLLALPDVVRSERVSEDSEAIWKLTHTALNRALKQLTDMRKTEGASMERDLRKRFDRLKRPLAAIKVRAPRLAKRSVEALRKRLASMGVEFAAHDPGLTREIAFIADRSDISEEIVRLESHFEQVPKLMGSAGPVGRALDFLCQEMFREINTIGSKANDAGISRSVIAFKTILESVREQVQNVE